MLEVVGIIFKIYRGRFFLNALHILLMACHLFDRLDVDPGDFVAVNLSSARSKRSQALNVYMAEVQYLSIYFLPTHNL